MSGRSSSSTGGKARRAGAGSTATIELTPRLTKGLDDETIVVTAYEPDPGVWEADFRRKKP